MSTTKAYEIIVVDDGSTDLTGQILGQSLRDFGTLRVIQHEQSCGQSTAVHTGVKAANYPVIATLDGDGQNDPADIPRLFDVLMQQGNLGKLWMVAGWRNKRHDSAWFLDLPYFDHMHRFLPALIIRAGGQVVSEPVNHRARSKGISKYGTLDRLSAGIVDLAGVLWLKQRAIVPITKEIQRGI
jgi:dolichol-phosphate mannosyltransferase